MSHIPLEDGDKNSPDGVINSVVSPFLFDNAASQLGYHVAKNGHTILVTSQNIKTADYHFIQGALRFADANPERKIFIEVHYPEDSHPIPYRDIETVHPNVQVDFLPYKRPNIPSYPNIMTHTAAVIACDAVICLEGGIGTSIAGSIAIERGIPVMAVRASGGSAQELYDALRAKYPTSGLRARHTLNVRRLLGNQWNSDSAEDITKAMEFLGRSVDFAILCPLQEEREAVIRALVKAGSSVERAEIDRKTYWRTQLHVYEGPPYSIVVGQLSAMGNVAGALSTSNVIDRWHPRAILVVGLAGTLDDAVKPGDVVIGSAVLYNEMGKTKDGSFQSEPYMYPADALLYGQAKTLPDWTWGFPRSLRRGKRITPSVHFGVIAAGEKVLADQELKAALVKIHRKLLAVEMESAGVSMAAQNETDPVRQLSIRGISDWANSTKDTSDKSQNWRPDAANAAAEFAVHFIRHCIL